MWDIVFLANAIGQKYEAFLIPFAFFALSTHPNGFVEMVVESVELFKQRNHKALETLSTIHSRFCVRTMKNKVCRKRHVPHTYRFFETPQERGKYTYIMDVDVMLLENIIDQFVNNWPIGCVVNNMIRCDENGSSVRRLTGMHMVQTDLYYTEALQKEQLNAYQRTHSNTNDEFILHNMVQKCHRLPPVSHRFRPICGIHFSPNRGRGKRMELCTSKHYAQIFHMYATRHPKLFDLPQFAHLSQQLKEEFHIL